jgi:hypothetical protein
MNIHAESMLSDSVAGMMLTMESNNDCPSQIAGGAGADKAMLAVWIQGLKSHRTFGY